MASKYLSRTFGSAGNQKTITISFWIKRSALSSANEIISQGSGSACHITFDSSNQIEMNLRNSVDGGSNVFLITSQLFRDVSAWYHIVLALDTTQATNTNRAKLYVNGTQVTAFSTTTYPSQNGNLFFNEASAMEIGKAVGGSSYFDGSMASVYFIDGQALTPSSFGETDATTGIWKPKSYSGTYGTNGFFLRFASSGSLGTDSSGNGNNWTVNNTPTQTLDTPSNVFAVLNPLFPFNDNLTFSNGNLRATKPSGSATGSFYGSFGVTAGKWYWKMKCNAVGGNDQWIGIGQMRTLTPSGYPGNDTYCVAAGSGGEVRYNGTTVSSYTMASWTSGDTIMIALDMTNSRVYWGKNGTWQDSGDPVAGTNPYTNATIFDGNFIMPVGSLYQSNGDVSYNFGNGYFTTTAISSPYSDGAGLGKFQYQPPTGYYALCTKNINVYG